MAPKGKRTTNPFTVLGLSVAQPAPAGQGPPRKKSRWNERERTIRAMPLPEYARKHYAKESRGHGITPRTWKLCEDMFGHLSRWRGVVTLREVNTEFLHGFKEYFNDLVPDEMTAETANKHLRQLRSIGNHAAKMRLTRKIEFGKANLFPEKELDPAVWGADDLLKILRAAQAVNGFVGKQSRDGYQIPAGVWWFAWVRSIAWAGCRLNAMMLSERGDFQNGVLFLKHDNQKQKRDQKIQLPPRSRTAIEDLLAAHDQPQIFPWPYDKPKPGDESCWKTFFNHFQKHLLDPCGLTLPSGVKTRMFRRTAATTVDEMGGNAQELCDHKNRSTTENNYMPRSRRVRVTKQALLIPEPDVAIQRTLFEREAG
jgi:integrase